jgi:hypothetical protein
VLLGGRKAGDDRATSVHESVVVTVEPVDREVPTIAGPR